jgi:membrane associated rhomboid family serine protease
MMQNKLPFPIAPVTLVLILVSVIFSLLSSLGGKPEILAPFLFSEYLGSGFTEILHGEFWRLLTPIFIHFGLIHILFNMMWLYDLGTIIELKQGSPRFGLLVGIMGVLSNLGQYLWDGPLFGGMSGVVYGLLAYIWVQSKLNPRFNLVLHNYVVYMMLGWFVACWVGLIPNVANMGHTVGLVSGLLLGWIFSPNKTMRI